MQFNSRQGLCCYLWYHNSHNSRFGAFLQKFYSNAFSNVGRYGSGTNASVTGCSDWSPIAGNTFPGLDPTFQSLGFRDWSQNLTVTQFPESSATNRRQLGMPSKRLIAKGRPSDGAKHRCKCLCRAWKWTPFWLVAKLVFAGSRFSVKTMRSYFTGFKRLYSRTNSRHTKSGQLATISYVIQHTAMSETYQKSAKNSHVNYTRLRTTIVRHSSLA